MTHFSICKINILRQTVTFAKVAPNNVEWPVRKIDVLNPRFIELKHADFDTNYLLLARRSYGRYDNIVIKDGSLLNL